MYEWLEKELAEIKTGKFHLVNQPTLEGRVPAEIEWPIPPPPSFQRFIEKFGNAFLYRELSCHLIRVFAKPLLRTDRIGEPYLEFGGYDSGDACFKVSQETGKEAPVFERRGFSGLFQTAARFDEWLEGRARAAKKRFGKRRWKKICEGPPPFSAEEEAIVRARSKFRWKVVGISEHRKLIFEVRNDSDRTLPFLTIGIKSRMLLGGLWLPISELMPGKTARIEADAYANQVDPRDVIAFDEPDPGPEDRERYWEFGMPE